MSPREEELMPLDDFGPKSRLQFELYLQQLKRHEANFEQRRAQKNLEFPQLPALGIAARPGFNLLQLKGVEDELNRNPHLRKCWAIAPNSFSVLKTDAGVFDETICSIAYHLYKHGQNHAGHETLYRTVEEYTQAAQTYWEAHKSVRELNKQGYVELAKGTYTADGKIVSFWG